MSSEEFHDDRILNDMRALAQYYVKSKALNLLTDQERMRLRLQFEKLRDQLRDQTLKDYSQFEFLEKLYTLFC